MKASWQTLLAWHTTLTLSCQHAASCATARRATRLSTAQGHGRLALSLAELKASLFAASRASVEARKTSMPVPLHSLKCLQKSGHATSSPASHMLGKWTVTGLSVRWAAMCSGRSPGKCSASASLQPSPMQFVKPIWLVVRRSRRTSCDHPLKLSTRHLWMQEQQRNGRNCRRVPCQAQAI